MFDYLPKTFHLKNARDDPEYIKFLEAFHKISQEKSSIWIIKPGEITNRGHGIKVTSDLKEIKEVLNSREMHKNGMYKTYIIQ